eukprot:GFYU01015632.1.p1 GENE.GFYU01015632.1~~GFYU01015632.1.p1  ORF type:complete len:385 (+),score=110.62 GFYU01015632.1:258-1412(+)
MSRNAITDDPFGVIFQNIDEAYHLSRKAESNRARCYALADRLAFLQQPLQEKQKSLDRTRYKQVYELKDCIEKAVDLIEKWGGQTSAIKRLFTSEKDVDKQYAAIDRQLSQLCDGLELVVVKNLDDLANRSDAGDKQAKQELQHTKERAVECNHWGMKCYMARDYTKAEHYYLEAIKIDPQNSDALNNYGLLLENVHRDTPRAEEFYKRAIAANPKNADALYNYNTLSKQTYKDFVQDAPVASEPVASVQREDDVNPLSPVPRQSYPNVPRKVHEKDLDMVLDSSTADIAMTSESNNEVAMKYYLSKDYEKAEIYYRRAIELNPKNSDALNNLGLLIENYHKDFEMAEEFYKKAIAANPKNMDALYNYNTLSRSVYRDFIDHMG